MRPPAARGFTLVEMLVVCAMMSILAMAVLPLAEISLARWKERELRAALREIRGAIDAYKKAADQIGTPKSGESGESGYPPSLQALVDGLADPRPRAPSPRLVFLRRVPRDPFAPDGVVPEQSWGLRSYASPAHAPRPGVDVYDVYSLSARTGSNGIALRNW